MQKLDSHSETPLYRQLYDEIKYAVETGVYKSGEQIPSEDKLREIYGISRITVRKALAELTEDNILIKKHGKGTFVSKVDYVEKTVGADGSFSKSCQLMGAVPGTRILLQQNEKAGKRLAEILGVSQGDEILHIERLRSVNDVPVIIESDYFTEEFRFLHTLDLNGKSLLQIIKEYGKRNIRQFQDTMDIDSATPNQAELLHCEPKHPLLRIYQKVYGTNGQLLYYNEQRILSDHYKYAVNITLL